MYFPSNLAQAFFRSAAVIGRNFAGCGCGTRMMLSSVSSTVPCAAPDSTPGPLPLRCSVFEGADRDAGKSPGAGGCYSGSGCSGGGAGSAGGSGGGPSWASARGDISIKIDIRT